MDKRFILGLEGATSDPVAPIVCAVAIDLVVVACGSASDGLDPVEVFVEIVVERTVDDAVAEVDAAAVGAAGS